MVNATLMNIADNPTNVQLPGVYKVGQHRYGAVHAEPNSVTCLPGKAAQLLLWRWGCGSFFAMCYVPALQCVAAHAFCCGASMPPM
jgi:hypothetical protein